MQRRTTLLMRNAKAGQRGYNLVEVLIAMALLAVVSLSILTLFFMAKSNIYAGRQMTHAISVATRITEDLSALPVSSIYTNFNVTSADTLGTVTVNPTSLPESSYTGSFTRSTTAVATAGTCTGTPLIAFTNDTNAFLRRWYCQMNSVNNQLSNSSITLVFTPRNQYPAADPLTNANATVVKIRAILRWKESLRNRQLIVDVTKTRRPQG
jgi:prepilin-type N-terminal cleavage/methylation domain-containing protein